MTAEKSANTHFSYVQTEISTFKWQRFEWKGGGAGLGGEGAVVCFMCEVAWSAKSYE